MSKSCWVCESSGENHHMRQQDSTWSIASGSPEQHYYWICDSCGHREDGGFRERETAKQREDSSA